MFQTNACAVEALADVSLRFERLCFRRTLVRLKLPHLQGELNDALRFQTNACAVEAPRRGPVRSRSRSFRRTLVRLKRPTVGREGRPARFQTNACAVEANCCGW